MSVSDDQWKDRYLRSLDKLEQKEKQWEQAEDLLRRALGRLAHAGYGHDRSLDRQLDRVRDAVRGRRDAQSLDRLVREAGDTAVEVQERAQQGGRETGQALARLLSALPLEAGAKKRAARLSKELENADTLDHLRPLLRQANTLVAEAGGLPPVPTPQPAAPQATDTQAPPTRSGGLLNRLLGRNEPPPPPATASAAAPPAPPSAHTLELLLERLQPGAPWSQRIAALRQQAAACRDEDEALALLDQAAAVLAEILQTAEGADPDARPVVECLPSAGEALLELVQKIEIPQHLQERATTIKGSLEQAATPQQVRLVVQSIADLMGDIRREIQGERQELERFLEGVTSRIHSLGERVAELGGNRRSSADSRADFQRSFNHEMADMRTRMRATDDLEQLKLAIEQGLDAIEGHMGEYVEREDGLAREAQERIDDLTSRLHDMKHEAFLLQQKMAAQRQQALKDPLTGALNRLAYDERLEAEIQRWRRYGNPLSLMVLDIDHFKRVNDGFGHLAGDKALKALALRLGQNVREVDVVARYGGEEFVVIMPDTDGEQAYTVAEKLRQVVAAAGFHYRRQPVGITISLGVASFRAGDDAASAFQRADEALYQAKQSGRNRTCREQVAGDE